MTTKTVLFIISLLICIGTWGCTPDAPSSVAKPQTDTTKTKKSLITITAIRSDSVGATLKGVRTNQAPRTLQQGDALGFGEHIRTDDAMEAEIRFDPGTYVLLGPNSEITVGNNPHILPSKGTITISRQLGAPSPLVIEVEKTQFSIVNGKTIVRKSDDKTIINVKSGEILDLAANQYVGTGETVTLQSSKPPVRAPQNEQTYIAPPNWSNPIVPIKEIPTALLENTLHRGIGTLVARNPRTNKTNQHALTMDVHDVNVQLQDGVAITRVEEAFTNQSNATIEATYRFLVPANAHITRLALDVNGRIEEGEVLEKKRAARIFKKIVDDSVRPKDPALLEWEQGSTFKMKIFPIKPKETRRVFLTYTTSLTSSYGTYKYEYPLANPKGAVKVGKFNIQAKIQSQRPLRSVTTPLYSTAIEQESTQATIGFKTQNRTPQNDFVVEFETEPSTSELRNLVQTEKNGQSYGMFLWQPRATAVGKSTPRNVLAIVDTSYGTSQELIELAAATTAEMIGGLGHQDRFNVLACDDSCHLLLDQFAAPTASQLIKVYEKLSSTSPGGASNLLGSFQTAFKMAQGKDALEIVYLGDGIATSGETRQSELQRLLKLTKPANARVHTIGVGPNIDSVFLEQLASSLEGAHYNLSVGETPSLAAWNISRFFSQDALCDIQIQLTTPQGNSIPTYPSRVGFLPAGKELMFTGQLPSTILAQGTQATLVIRAKHKNGSPYQKDYTVLLKPSPPATGFISRLWAAAHITQSEFSGGDPKQIVDVSRKFRIASRYTSWIVLENQRMYDAFNVQRTDAEQYDGADAQFLEAEETSVDKADLDQLDDEMPSGLQTQSEYASSGSGGRVEKRESTSISRAAPRKKMRAPSISYPDPLSSSLDALPSENKELNKASIASNSHRDYRPARCRPSYKIAITKASPASAQTNNKASSLSQQLVLHPLSRTIHRRYVRHLAKLDNRDLALAAANKWRQLDPYSRNALSSYAAELARFGDRKQSTRIYSAMSETSPKNRKTHLRLAKMFRDKGDFVAAAGHYKAAISLSTQKDTSIVKDYLFALVLSGHHQLFEHETQDRTTNHKLQSTIDQLLQSIQTGIVPTWPNPINKGILRVKLSQTTEDLDILLVDPYGRVQSGAWRFGADAKDWTSTNEETLFSQVSQLGNYRVVVARTNTSNNNTPVSGTLVVSLRGKSQKIPFHLQGNSQIIAKIKYQQGPQKRCYSYPR